MIAIKRGIIRRPQRIVIYAPEGLGKSTLASKLPNALFFDFEPGGTDHLDVVRPDPQPKTLKDVETLLDSLAKDPQGFENLVLDTIDWLEELVIAAVLTEGGKKSIEDFGFGKGYVMLAERFGGLLTKINLVSQRMNIICLAHVHVKKFELPDTAGSFDRYELKLSKQVGPLVREWCDALLFGNWKTKLREIEDGDKTTYKAHSAKERMLYAGHTAAWDAKNRHGLKDEETWSEASLMKCLGAPVTITPAPATVVTAKQVVEKAAAAVRTVAGSAADYAKSEPPAKIDTTVSAKDDTIPHLEPVVEESKAHAVCNALPETVVTGEHALSAVVGENEAAANAYLLSRNEIKAGQTFRDVTPKYVERCLRSPAAWVAQFMKGVAA